MLYSRCRHAARRIWTTVLRWGHDLPQCCVLWWRANRKCLWSRRHQVLLWTRVYAFRQNCVLC